MEEKVLKLCVEQTEPRTLIISIVCRNYIADCKDSKTFPISTERAAVAKQVA